MFEEGPAMYWIMGQRLIGSFEVFKAKRCERKQKAAAMPPVA